LAGRGWSLRFRSCVIDLRVGTGFGVVLDDEVTVVEYLDDDRPVGVGGDVADGALVVVGDDPHAGQVYLLVLVGDDLDDLGGEVEGGSDCPRTGGVVESGVVPPLQGAVGGVRAGLDDFDHAVLPSSYQSAGMSSGAGS